MSVFMNIGVCVRYDFYWGVGCIEISYATTRNRWLENRYQAHKISHANNWSLEITEIGHLTICHNYDTGTSNSAWYCTLHACVLDNHQHCLLYFVSYLTDTLMVYAHRYINGMHAVTMITMAYAQSGMITMVYVHI